MVRTLSAFLDFCYLVRRPMLDEAALDALDEALSRFHRERVVFDDIRLAGYSLPRQHSMKHYRFLTELFGAPNGLCSSITESKHIPAVKEPWRRSSRNKPLGEMLLTNQRLDKLSACREDFKARGMLIGSCSAEPVLLYPDPPLDQNPAQPEHVDDGDSDPVNGPRADAQVILAKTKGKQNSTSSSPYYDF